MGRAGSPSRAAGRGAAPSRPPSTMAARTAAAFRGCATEEHVEHRLVGGSEHGHDRGTRLGELGDHRRALEVQDEDVRTLLARSSSCPSSGSLKSRSPAWNTVSRNWPERSSNGADQSEDRHVRILGPFDDLAIAGGGLGRDAVEVEPRAVRRAAAARRSSRAQPSDAACGHPPCGTRRARTRRSASSGSTYGSSNSPRRNLSRRSRRADSSMRASETRPLANEPDEDLRAAPRRRTGRRPRRAIFTHALLDAQLLDAPGLRLPAASRPASAGR